MKPLTSQALVIGEWTELRTVFLTVVLLITCLSTGCDSATDSKVVAAADQEGQAAQETKRDDKARGESLAVKGIEKQDPQEKKADMKAGSALDQAVQSITEAPMVDPGGRPIDGAPVEVVPAHEELLPLIEKHWIRLHPQYEIWLDDKNKQVIVGGRICFRNGPLEMFACPYRTKEHESIVSTVSNGEIVHIGLLATGAIPGKPVQWNPDFVAASGPVVHINVVWSEDGARKEIRAQEMITDMIKNEPLQHEFVYCGSGEWVDPDNPSYREFWADSGDLICVSNFTTALLDLQVESSNAGDGLMFHANPDKIPELGKPVLLFLKPVQPKPDDAGAETDEKTETDTKAKGEAATSDKQQERPIRGL